MQIEMTELEPCKYSIHYETNSEAILDKKAEVIKLFKNAPVKGYRQGKATLEAIKFTYKNQIEDALKRALAEDAYHNCIFEKKLRVHGTPNFTSAFLNDGKFICDFELHTKPDFELAQFKTFEIPKPHQDTNDLLLSEKMLQDFRVKAGEVIPYSELDFVQSGDNVIVDYTGSIDGQKIDNLSGQGELLTIGTSQLVDFDTNLLGMTIGETREFSLTVPPTGLPSMVGKTINFSVTLSMGSKTTPAPLDDSLAARVGKKDMVELREFIHETAITKIAEHFKSLVNEQVALKLLESHSFEVPNWMALAEAQYLVHSAKLTWDTLPDSDKEKYLEMSTKNVKLSLILDKLSEEPDVQLSNQEIFDIIRRNMTQNNVQEPNTVMEKMAKTGELNILMARIKEQHCLDYVVKNVRIVD